MEVDPRITLAIECALAASRWRVAARFEGPSRRAQYQRLSELRSAGATALLHEVVVADGRCEAPPSAPRRAPRGEGKRAEWE